MIAINCRLTVLVMTAGILLTACKNEKASSLYNEWKIAGGNADGNKYTSLIQVDSSNVQQLVVAWEYHTGDGDTAAHSQIQCNPIMVKGVLYATSPQLKLLALDAATGKPKWVFSPFDSIKGNRR